MRVLLLAALTVDGKIARHAHELTAWSSSDDKRLFARTSREAGVVIMGRHTFETLPAPLPGRQHIVLTRRATTDLPAESSAQVEFTDDPPARIVRRLAERGYTSAVLGGGAQTFRAFVTAGVVDELWLTVEPLAFGSGIALLGDEPLELHLRLLECRRLGEQSVLLRYAPQPSADEP